MTLFVHRMNLEWLPDFRYCKDCHVGYVLNHCRQKPCEQADSGQCLHCKTVYEKGEQVEPPVPESEMHWRSAQNRRDKK